MRPARNANVTELRAAALPSSCPPPPSYLHGRAQRLWAPTVRMLMAQGSWDTDCETLVCLYCVSLANTRLAIEHVSREGPIVEASVTNVAMHSVWRRVLAEASADALKYGGILGLTPDEETIFARQEARAERSRERA